MQRRNMVNEVAMRVRSSSDYYGTGYEDVSNRVPSINAIGNALGWAPKYSFDESLENILDSVY